MNKNLSKKNAKNTKELTDNTLNNEIEQIYSLLINISGDWDKRQNCLKKMAEYVTTLGCQSSTLIKNIERLAPCFQAQFFDLRSSITKEVAHLVNICATTLQGNFITAAEKIISTEGLLKLINNGNKLIAEMAHESVMNMIEYSQPLKCIPAIINEIKSKNGHARAKVIIYVGQIIKGYDEADVYKNMNCLQNAIKTVLSDANRAARDNAKEAFYEFQSNYPDEARKLLNSLEPQTRKHVEQSVTDRMPASSNTLTPSKTTSTFYLKKDATSTKIESQEKPKSAVLKENPSVFSKKNLQSTPKSPKPNGINNKADEQNVTTKLDKPPLRPYSNKSNSKLNTLQDNSGTYEELFNSKRVNSAYTKSKIKDDVTTSLDTKTKSIIEKPSLKNSNEYKTGINKSDKQQIAYSQNSLFYKNPQNNSTSNTMDISSKENQTHKLYDDNSSNSYESPKKQSKPKKTDCNLYDEVRNEDLAFQIENASSKNWATRVNSFNNLTEWFSEVDNKFKPQVDLKGPLLNQLVKIYVDHLDDNILKVQESCLQSLNSVFRILMTAFYNELDKLIGKTIKIITNCNDAILDQAYKLFEHFCNCFAVREILEALLRFYHELTSPKSQTKTIELVYLIFNNHIDIKDMTPSLVKSVFPKLSYIFVSFKQGDISIKKLIQLVLRVCLYYNYSVSYDSFNTLSASLQNNQTVFSENYDQKFLEALQNSHTCQKKADSKPLKTYDYGQNVHAKKQSIHNGSYQDNKNDNNSEASQTEQSDSSHTDYKRNANGKQNQSILSHKKEQKLVHENKNSIPMQKNSRQNSSYNITQQKNLTVNTNACNDDYADKRNLTVSPRKITNSKSVTSKSTKTKKALNSTTSNLKGILKQETDQKKSPPKMNKTLKNGFVSSRTEKPNTSAVNSKKSSMIDNLNKSNIRKERNSVKKSTKNSQKKVKSSKKSILKSDKSQIIDVNERTPKVSSKRIESSNYINESQSTKAETINASQLKISNVLDIHDYELDKIKLYTEKDLKKLIDILSISINDYVKNRYLKDLNYLLCKSIPFMIRMLLKFFNTELYNKVFEMLIEIPDYFNSCNESVRVLVKELIDLFFKVPNELLLLEDIVDIFIKIQYKAELFQTLINKIAVAQTPTLPLLIKVLQSMISADDQDKEQLHRALQPCLKLLIKIFKDQINNGMAEVRKSVVFCLVELKFLLDNNEFLEIIQNFEASHQKLVSVYIMRRNANNCE